MAACGLYTQSGKIGSALSSGTTVEAEQVDDAFAIQLRQKEKGGSIQTVQSKQKGWQRSDTTVEVKKVDDAQMIQPRQKGKVTSGLYNQNRKGGSALVLQLKRKW